LIARPLEMVSARFPAKSDHRERGRVDIHRAASVKTGGRTGFPADRPVLSVDFPDAGR
jgi:hypothetical protein